MGNPVQESEEEIISFTSTEFFKHLKQNPDIYSDSFKIAIENEEDFPEVSEQLKIRTYREWIHASLRSIYKHVNERWPNTNTRKGVREYRRFMDKYHVLITKNEDTEFSWKCVYGKDPENPITASELTLVNAA